MSIVNDIIELMWEYQKNNNIIKECITNAIFLCDQLNNNGFQAKVKAVIMTSVTENTFEVFGGHLVIDMGDDKLIDPSYETNFKENQNYFDNINTLLLAIPELKIKKELIADIVKHFINFVKIANDINIDNKLLISNIEYYNKQSDYVQMMINPA